MSLANRNLRPFETASSFLFSLFAILVALCLCLSLFFSFSSSCSIQVFFLFRLFILKHLRIDGKVQSQQREVLDTFDLFSPSEFILYNYSVLCLVAQPCLTLCNPMDCSLAGTSVHGDSPGKNTAVVAMPSSRESSQPSDQTEVSCTAGNCLPSEPLGKPKFTGVGIPSPGDLPDSGIEPSLLLAGRFFTS